MSRYILKNQKIPEKQKTKEWDVSHAYDFLQASTSVLNTPRQKEQLKCWQYYLCIADEQKEMANKTVTHPYGTSLGLEYQHYPLIESKIEQLVGEYLVRQLRKTAYVLNKSARSKKLDDMLDMVAEEIIRDFNLGLEQDLGFVPDTEQKERELPPDVEEFINEGKYKTKSEEIANIIITQVLEIKNNKDRIKDLLVDWFVQDEAIAIISQEGAHPSIERQNIFECIIDHDPMKEIQKDPQYFVRTKFVPYNEIINSYDLTDEEELLLKSYEGYGANNPELSNFAMDGYDNSRDRRLWFNETENIMQVRVLEMMWISYKQVKVRVSINKKTGKEIYKLLPEDSKAKGDDIKSEWMQYKRRLLMVGPDLVLEHGPMNERYSRVDDIKKDYLPVVAIRRNNFLNTKIRSVASKLMQLQDQASEALFEMKLTMRRNAGRVLVYDVAQTPKQFLKTGNYTSALNRVFHHIKKDQMLLINSADRNSRYAFNQFTSLDASTKGTLQELTNFILLIEDLASKFIGVSPERTSQIGQYQTGQNTERSIAQSTARTEVFTRPFDNFIEAILEKVILKAKHCYEENEVVEYLFGDINSRFLKIFPAFFQDDIGISISDGYKEKRSKDIIDRAAEVVMGNAQTPEMIKYLIEILDAETANESKQILNQGLAALEKIRQENQKAQQEMQQQQLQAEAQDKEEDRNVKREGYEKDIRVAQIRETGEALRHNSKLKADQITKLAEIENTLQKVAQKN